MPTCDAVLVTSTPCHRSTESRKSTASQPYPTRGIVRASHHRIQEQRDHSNPRPSCGTEARCITPYTAPRYHTRGGISHYTPRLDTTRGAVYMSSGKSHMNPTNKTILPPLRVTRGAAYVRIHRLSTHPERRRYPRPHLCTGLVWVGTHDTTHHRPSTAPETRTICPSSLNDGDTNVVSSFSSRPSRHPEGR